MLRPFRSVTLIKYAAAIVTIALGGCSLTQVSDLGSHATTPVTVCEVLKNLGRYRGKKVTIGGVYWYGLRQPCVDPFVTGEKVWPSAVDLASSQIVAGTQDAVPFRTDQLSWDKMETLVQQEAEAGRREEVWVTAIGVLRALQTRKDGQVVGAYGDLGTFPAQLIIERVVNVEIRPNPTYDYSVLLRAHK
jgi:hypothetical protein